MSLKKLITEFRDYLLSVTAVIYILGYSVWSIHAWRNGMGLLPALEAQYIIAGIVPTVMIGLIYYVIKNLPQLKLSHWNIKRRVSYWCIGAPIIGLIFLTDSAWHKEYGTLLLVAFLLWGMWSQSPLHSMPASPSGNLRLYYAAGNFLMETYLMPILLAIIGLWGYIGYAYPSLPQELGGMKPRCAYLDIKNGQLSHETLTQILPSKSQESNETVVRSVSVQVLFAKSDAILLKPLEDSTTKSVYEIRKNAIQVLSFFPCPGNPSL